MFFIVTNFVNLYFYMELTKEKKDIGGVNTENRKIFNDMLDHDVTGRYKIPGIMA